MRLKNIYLTIDDSPSKSLNEKLNFLLLRKIPAVLFCRGEFMENHMNHVVYAIKNGFLIGNHSYSHPYFSKLSVEECKKEILKTEHLIDEAYKLANIKRLKKIVRLPFGDLGGANSEALASFLNEEGFQHLQFEHFKYSSIHIPWELDTMDYKNRFIENSKLYIDNLKNTFESYERDTAVVLLHDFDHNSNLFYLSLEFFLENNLNFIPF